MKKLSGKELTRKKIGIDAPGRLFLTGVLDLSALFLDLVGLERSTILAGGAGGGSGSVGSAGSIGGGGIRTS